MILNVIMILNIAICAAFMLCYAYQIFYIIYALFKKPREYPETDERKKYAFIVSARNEEEVIGQLCETVWAQNYPRELIDLIVIADNCTDATAKVARDGGAIVYERFNKEKVGKGYALEYLFDSLKEEGRLSDYEGFFIIDADNLLDENFALEMNKVVVSGEKIIVSYRNSTNFGANWISSGYALWFIRTAKHLNSPRNNLGLTCEVQGTGFFVHREVIERQGGWIHHLLVEDNEFTIDNLLSGQRVAYCDRATVYDEQPTEFGQSWNQRKRWVKGYLQVLKNYGGKLVGGFFKGGGFAYFDMIMAMMPAMILSLFALAANVVGLIVTLIFSRAEVLFALACTLATMLSAYFLFLFVGLVCLITEWKRIDASAGRKILTVFTFPLFMYTYIPISGAALFSRRVEWKQMKHHRAEGK